MISAYLLITSDQIFAFFRSLVRADDAAHFDDLARRIDRGLKGVVRGQLVICLVNGVLSAIGFYIAGLAYWPVLALVATVLSIIPIFGAFLSSVPAVAIGLQQGVGTSVFVLLWIIGIHQVEANFLNPKIMGDAAKVHPVLIIFSLLVGEHFFGFVGALLAVPVLSIVQSVFLHFRSIAIPTEQSVPVSDQRT
jgi:predicted PurR-regulated permease PerM